jgi:hypothetical protein
MSLLPYIIGCVGETYLLWAILTWRCVVLSTIAQLPRVARKLHAIPHSHHKFVLVGCRMELLGTVAT